MNANPVYKYESSTAYIKSESDFNIISDPSINLVVWDRSHYPAPLAIQELKNSHFSSTQIVFERNQPLEVIGGWLDDELGLLSRDAHLLYFDIMMLAEIFLGLSNDKTIGIRLERVTSDNCASFHTDYLSLRLLCTYWGEATEWLENSNVMREGLRKNNNSLVVKNMKEIKKFKTNWVGVLKGENYPDNMNNSVVHRSPQISTKVSSDRILLRMDTLERFGGTR